MAPQELLAVVRDPAFHEQNVSEPGEKVVCTVSEPAAGQLEIVLQISRPKESKQPAGTTRRYLWNTEALQGTWSDVPSEHADRVRAGGAMRITPTGSGARLVVEGEISIRVPVVGRFIEKKVAAAIEGQCERERLLCERFLVARGALP